VSDFDFLYGTWSIENRRLREPLTGSDYWYEFASSKTCWPLLGGVGNIDEIEFPETGGSGMTLRLHNQQTGEWSLYWSNSETGVLFPPVVGRFEGGRGEFFGDDVHNGMPVRVRFTWSEITPTSAVWEQAYSTDEENWETNWSMRFARTD
jgi:hypothetical protein